jgi:hypothetical protein
VREEQRKQRTVELTVFREARREVTELIAVLRGEGLEEVERRFAAEARVLEEHLTEQVKRAEQVEKKLEAMGRSLSIERTGERSEKVPEKREPQREQDPVERARTDRAFFEQSQKQVSREWDAVYRETMKSIAEEVAPQQEKDRQEVEKWWRGRAETIGGNIEAARGILEENQKQHGEFSRQARGSEDAIRRFEKEKASLEEERKERLREIEGRSGLDTIDRLAQTRIEQEYPELMDRLKTLHEIGQEWHTHDEQKEKNRQLELARTDRGFFERLDRQVKEEWTAAWEKCEPRALAQIIEGQMPERERLAEIASEIGNCGMTLELIAERQKKLFVSREERKALAADAEQTRADQKRYTQEYQQLSGRLEAEKLPENVRDKAAILAMEENPELIKKLFALEEIGKEWKQRDIREFELQRKQERGQQREGPELGFKKEQGRSDDGMEKDRRRERKGPELEL